MELMDELTAIDFEDLLPEENYLDFYSNDVISLRTSTGNTLTFRENYTKMDSDEMNEDDYYAASESFN